MISSEHRFHGPSSLNFVYRNGRTQRGPYFAIKYCLNERRQTYRLAVVVSRKVNKSAVARNRLRRQLYESVRLLQPRLSQPYDIVISVFDDSLSKIESESLNRQVEKRLAQAGIISAKRARPKTISTPQA